METNKNKAKELYIKYLGDIFNMMRDGVSYEYSKYNIPIDEEKEWMNELFSNEIEKLNINDVSTLSSIWLILRLNSDLLNQYLQTVVDFIIHNKYKIISKNNFLIFSQKIIDIIDFYLDKNYSSVSRTLLKNEKQKLLDSRNE